MHKPKLLKNIWERKKCVAGLWVQVFIVDNRRNSEKSEKRKKDSCISCCNCVARTLSPKSFTRPTTMSRLIRIPCGKWTRFYPRRFLFWLEVAPSFHGCYRRLFIAINYLIVIYCKSFNSRHVDLVSRARFCSYFIFSLSTIKKTCASTHRNTAFDKSKWTTSVTPLDTKWNQRKRRELMHHIRCMENERILLRSRYWPTTDFLYSINSLTKWYMN